MIESQSLDDRAIHLAGLWREELRSILLADRQEAIDALDGMDAGEGKAKKKGKEDQKEGSPPVALDPATPRIEPRRSVYGPVIELTLIGVLLFAAMDVRPPQVPRPSPSGRSVARVPTWQPPSKPRRVRRVPSAPPTPQAVPPDPIHDRDLSG